MEMSAPRSTTIESLVAALDPIARLVIKADLARCTLGLESTRFDLNTDPVAALIPLTARGESRASQRDVRSVLEAKTATNSHHGLLMAYARSSLQLAESSVRTRQE
jgi:hypothetical protein